MTTDWGRDPFALGSYSHCRVGSAGAREVYEEVLADRVFFAGEAASCELAVTVGGAWSSGHAAAERIVAMLVR
ncbi:FAD-dependent oxidoreductase [Rhizobiaceae sp. 2RAB30]